MTRVKPSFMIFLRNRAAIGNTNILLFLFIGPLLIVCAITIFLSTNRYHNPYSPLFILSILAFLIIGVGFAFFLHWQRFRKLIPIFESGIEVNGNIVDVRFANGCDYITSEYQYQNEKYQSTEIINRNRKTKNISRGQQVVLYVNQQQPKQAFIRDLYLNTF